MLHEDVWNPSKPYIVVLGIYVKSAKTHTCKQVQGLFNIIPYGKSIPAVLRGGASGWNPTPHLKSHFWVLDSNSFITAFNCVSNYLTLSALGGARPSIAWLWPALFNNSPGAYWAIIHSILIIILFKEKINDYLEKELGQLSWKLAKTLQFLSAKKFFEKFWEFHFSNLKSSWLSHFLRYQA